MDNEKEKIPPIKHLRFKKGDLIVKEGDYGISIYKIIKGKVSLFRESDDKEISLGTLGPGGVIGEMNFLDRALEARFASARAMENTEMEAWHPARLAKEYEQMPKIIRYIADQTLRRLMRMNRVIAQLRAKKREEEEKAKLENSGPGQRDYYRKEVNLDCIYRPIEYSPKVRLEGRIRDISLKGIGLEVRGKNVKSYSHKSGRKFHMETVLPNGKDLSFTAKIVFVAKNPTPGRLFFGMTFDEMTDDARKWLGFFLMPT